MKVVNKCNRFLGFIIRNSLHFNNPQTVLNLYYAFIFSKLNFASVVWNPQYAVYQQRLERIQNKFLRFLSRKADVVIVNGNYKPILEKFSILTLTRRRAVSDLIMIYKLVNGLVDSPTLTSKLIFNLPIRGLRLQNLFNIPFRNTNSGKNSPLCRATRSYNDLHLGMEVFDMSMVRKYVKGLP